MPTFQATLASGRVFAAPADEPLLLAAERAGITPPSSCRNGSCRTCLSQLASGRVTYRIDWPGVSGEERRDGWFLPCVAYPASDLVLR
jgi:ferredoxin